MTLNIRAHRSNLSRRLGPVFAEAALEAQEGPKTGQDKPAYPTGWGTSPRRAPKAAANPQMAALKVPAKAYKPAHGGYPG